MVNNMLYDANQIREILPHRYPFLLIDRVVDIIDDKKVIAIKCVSQNEPFFQGHFPQAPIMPGVLQLEAMAQAGAIAILRREENKGKLAIFAGANNVKWRKMIVPGDVLEIEVELTKQKGPFGFGEGTIKVDGKVACQAEISFVIQ